MGKIARALLTFDREHERFARSLAEFQEGSMRQRAQEIGDSFVEGTTRPWRTAARRAWRHAWRGWTRS